MDKKDIQSWLPEFDPPGISLDLPSLSLSDASPSQSDKQPEAINASHSHEHPEDTDTNHSNEQPDGNTDAAAKTPAVPANTKAPPNNFHSEEAVVYANLSEYASMVSDDNDDDDIEAEDSHIAALRFPTATHAEPKPLNHPTPAPNDDARKDPGPTSDDDFLDRLRLDFDFHTDPAIDAISTSQLFVAPVHGAAADPAGSTSGSSDSSQQKQQSAGRKAKSRRASIAGLLMRRTSKYVDAVAPTAPPVSEVGVASLGEPAVLSAPSAESVDLMPPSVVAEAVSVTEAAPVTEAHIATNTSNEAAPAATVDTAESACADDADAVVAKDAQSVDAQPSASSHSAAASANGIHGPATDTNPDVQTEPPSAIIIALNDAAPTANHPSLPDTTASPTENHHTADASTESHSLAQSSLPPVSRSVGKRSSRILSGISRKVNHVRQTTSMVLRRSVGSRLSMAPGKSADNVGKQGSGMAQDEPPKYTSNDMMDVGGGAGAADAGNVEAEIADAGNAEAETADAGEVDAEAADADKVAADTAEIVADAGELAVEAEDTGSTTEAVDAASSASDAASSNAESAGSESDSSSSSSSAADSNSSIEAAEVSADTAETDTSDKEEEEEEEHDNGKDRLDAGDKDGLDARATLSRRFGMVRRGTNEAVRNGVSRVKHIFASKRPVVA
ncbi:hypothetical protein IWW50_001845 [Coemansia erecta]|nr:hypothetical protein IWW50_001845 [Coemansia erecta]